jgi:hypothetical protein
LADRKQIIDPPDGESGDASTDELQQASTEDLDLDEWEDILAYPVNLEPLMEPKDLRMAIDPPSGELNDEDPMNRRRLLSRTCTGLSWRPF